MLSHDGKQKPLRLVVYSGGCHQRAMEGGRGCPSPSKAVSLFGSLVIILLEETEAPPPPPPPPHTHTHLNRPEHNLNTTWWLVGDCAEQIGRARNGLLKDIIFITC